MQSIITIIIIVWIISSIFGVLQKNVQKPPRHTRPGQRRTAMPPFGLPQFPVPKYERPPKRMEVSSERQAGSTVNVPAERPSVSDAGDVWTNPAPSLETFGQENFDPARSDDWNPVMTTRVDEVASDSSTYDWTKDEIDDDIFIQVYDQTDEYMNDGITDQMSGKRNTYALESPGSRRSSHPLLQHQNIVNGIIWSEIFGPPKSRKKYK